MRKRLIVALVPVLSLAACGSDSSGGTPTPSPTPSTYTIGGTISGLTGTGLVLRAGSDTLTLTRGATGFTFATAVAAGTAYSVTVATQPSAPAQTCTVQNGTGTAAANVTGVAVTCTTDTQTYVYVVNGSESYLSLSSITTLRLDPTNGALTSLGSLTGYTPCATVVTLAQPTRLVFAADSVPLSTSARSCLTKLQTADLNTTDFLPGRVSADAYEDQHPVGIYPHPGGTIAYYLRSPSVSTETASGLGQLRPYSVASATGPVLTGTPVDAGLNPRSAIVDPAGRYVIVADQGAGLATGATLRTFTTTTPTAPTPATTFTTPTPPWALAYAAVGPYVYASSPSTTVGYAFTVDTAGKVTPIGGGSFASIAGVQLYATTGRFLFAAAPATGLVQAYQIGSTGIPTATGAAIRSGTLPVQMIVDPTGRYLLVLNRGTATFGSSTGEQSSVAVYAIGSDGGLTAIAGSPFAAGQAGIGFAIASRVPAS